MTCVPVLLTSYSVMVPLEFIHIPSEPTCSQTMLYMYNKMLICNLPQRGYFRKGQKHSLHACGRQNSIVITIDLQSSSTGTNTTSTYPLLPNMQ